MTYWFGKNLENPEGKLATAKARQQVEIKKEDIYAQQDIAKKDPTTTDRPIGK